MDKFTNLCTRAAAIVFYNNSILLMYRKKNGKIYYVFPGGTIEKHESSQTAAIRELFEETSIIAEPIKLLYNLRITDIPTKDKNILSYKDEFFFLCKYISGNPNLSEKSEEYQRSSHNNFYKPKWLPINQIKNILLYPLEIRDLLVQDLRDDFKSNETKIEINYSKLRDL
jgi:8-oxo-dGTP diphosphatase